MSDYRKPRHLPRIAERQTPFTASQCIREGTTEDLKLESLPVLHHIIIRGMACISMWGKKQMFTSTYKYTDLTTYSWSPQPFGYQILRLRVSNITSIHDCAIEKETPSSIYASPHLPRFCTRFTPSWKLRLLIFKAPRCPVILFPCTSFLGDLSSHSLPPLTMWSWRKLYYGAQKSIPSSCGLNENTQFSIPSSFASQVTQLSLFCILLRE